jgi:DnaJ-class molecular chaperone
MKRIEEQTLYEILEVSPQATPKEIQKAYEHSKETFSQDSPAVYSLFRDQDIQTIRAAVEEAYRVLMDDRLRKEYDQSHHIERVEEPPEDEASRLPFTEISVDVAGEILRGKALRQLRESMGVDLKKISEETRINIRVLGWIEEEAVENLPPLVYVKGFLKAYAKSLGLDSQKVIEDYMTLFAEKKKK